MTAPGDPLVTLADAMNNYVATQDAMREAATQFTSLPPVLPNPPDAATEGTINAISS